MQRRPTTQDITWFLDLARNGQLNLDPPYQRRSVWTRKDRQFFLDTIFRNYPSPAIFVHKTISENGMSTFHIVDGKQRTETILDFVNDRLRIASDFGDVRLDGKKWSELRGETELKKQFWNYQITVEMIDVVEGGLINEVFDRLNRNARKLTNQELRHAKYDGWFINEVEAEANREDWREFGIVTTARVKRMADVQFISELMLVVLENSILGFNQEALDILYAKYDVPSEQVPDFDEDIFRRRIATAIDYCRAIQTHNQAVSHFGKALANIYSLWSVVVLNDHLPEPIIFADKYRQFMEHVELVGNQTDLSSVQATNETLTQLAFAYWNNFRGANTDLPQRRARYQALVKATIAE